MGFLYSNGTELEKMARIVAAKKGRIRIQNPARI